MKANEALENIYIDANDDWHRIYDDRLEKAKKWYDANTNEGYRGIFEDIFPELKAQKGEKVMKLIDKDALVAEIKRLWNKYKNNDEDNKLTWFVAKLENFLDTLEVKEADLEKELDNWRHNHFHGRRDKDASGEYLKRVTQLELAKHFFELGLKAQKGMYNL